MARKRNPENRGLPTRWRLKHGAYYYQVPPGMEDHWDGKKLFRLGKTLPEAHRTWAERIEPRKDARKISDLLDQFASEHIPLLAPKTRQSYITALTRLRPVFGAMDIAKGDKESNIEPHHAYTYLDRRQSDHRAAIRGAKVAGKREIEVLSSTLSFAVEKGYIKRNPLLGRQFNTRGKVKVGRSRYIEDWEILEALSLDSRRKKGSVRMVQAYIRLKLLTGLRMTDMLQLRQTDLREDGIHVQPQKTEDSTGVRLVIEWSPELRAVIAQVMAARPVDIAPWLFCTGTGEPYFKVETGDANGFQSIWQRFMKRVLEETDVKESFAERDLRAKAATDAESLEAAMKLLAHADERTTREWYRRKPELVKPSRGI